MLLKTNVTFFILGHNFISFAMYVLREEKNISRFSKLWRPIPANAKLVFFFNHHLVIKVKADNCMLPNVLTSLLDLQL